ncbi:MAG TPA: hypothetical protein VHW02_07800 [Rhizomicrobium sp.]|jgi:hypothetical protein|nr:hypothetical protein [Rhizomicrobium sp.]
MTKANHRLRTAQDSIAAEQRRVEDILARDRDTSLPDRAGHEGRSPIYVPVKGERKVHGARIRNEGHCTICRLKFRKNITDLQHAAASRLQDDHAQAGLATIPGAKLEVGGCAYGPVEISQIKIDAEARLSKALTAVGTSARYLLEQIAINDCSAGEVADILRITRNAVLPALRVALDALSAHYGLSGSAREGSRIRTFHPFQDDNFSPSD